MDHKNLIEKAKSGNISALNTLLCGNYPILQGYVIKMTGNSDIAQDIVQETMLKAVINIKKFVPKAKFSTWLITIATNLYRDFLRKTKNLKLIDETIETKECGPEESLISNIEYNAVKEILIKLPYEKRAVFILKHYYGYKYEEIAEILKCPIGTVRSRLHNCIKYIISEMDRRGLI
ncbi:RNA polymerase sigma factor SigY [Clostridium psychrophilum]|uniref:RNA polymerase sigma factor SigY n=1 Tax=Clostridium psychrophilum TaxID=132926 RepID=UPI001C0C534D|nr:RNA polymerase sigma factor SigY [Clostridium psychrophilum]MBU3181963.1 RNA polymerase sigma factor SigY [Clostridium psychrophilum]